MEKLSLPSQHYTQARSGLTTQTEENETLPYLWSVIASSHVSIQMPGASLKVLGRRRVRRKRKRKRAEEGNSGNFAFWQNYPEGGNKRE
jgi:hypothetical protein